MIAFLSRSKGKLSFNAAPPFIGPEISAARLIYVSRKQPDALMFCDLSINKLNTRIE